MKELCVYLCVSFCGIVRFCGNVIMIVFEKLVCVCVCV